MVQTKQFSPRQFKWIYALVASAAPLTTSFTILSTTAAMVQFTGTQSALAATGMTVAKGTKVRIHSSNSMVAMNDALKNKFATQFAGSSVEVSQTSATKALEDVLAGRADLAAIGRPLTEQEKAQGLVASIIGRDKIAVVVNPQSSFTKDLTIPKFAQLFRGEITDWSQLGGAKDKITFVDRTNSDTRQALASYPAFKNAPLESGKNAVKLEDTSLNALISNLKGSAVSFLPANQARTNNKLRTLTMDGVLPTSPLYPFSQPLYYVHKPDANGGISNPVKAFLSFLGTEVGQSTIRQSGIAQVQKPGSDSVVAIAGEKAAKMEAGGGKVSGAGTNVGLAAGNPSGIGNKIGANNAENSNNTLATEADGNLFGLPFPGWLKWLLPLGLLGTGLLLLLLPNKRDNPNTPVLGSDDDRNDSGFGNPLTGEGDRAKNATSNTTEILDNTTNTALVGGAAAIGGLGTGAAAKLKGEGGNDNWNENDGAPYIRDETDLNLADRATGAAAGTTGIGTATWGFLKGKEEDTNGTAQDIEDAATTKLFKIKTNLDAPNITVPSVDGPGNFSLDQDWSFDDNTPDLKTMGSGFVDELKDGASNLTGGVTLAGAGIAAAGVGAAGAAIGSMTNSDRTQIVVDRSSIVIAPQNPREAVVRWQLTEVQKRDAKQQGGTDFALRLYDVTGINPESEVLENFYQYDCNELSQELRIEIPVPSRDYVVEVGYVDRGSEWYGIVRSHSVHIPST